MSKIIKISEKYIDKDLITDKKIFISSSIFSESIRLENKEYIEIKDSDINKQIEVETNKLLCKEITSQSFKNIFPKIVELELDSILEEYINFSNVLNIKSLSIKNSSFLLDLMKFTNLRKLKIEKCDYELFNNTRTMRELTLVGNIIQNTIDSIFKLKGGNIDVLSLNNSNTKDFINLVPIGNIRILKLTNINIEKIIFTSSLIDLELDNCNIKNFTVEDKIGIKKITINNIQNIYNLLVNDKTMIINFTDIYVDLILIPKNNIIEIELKQCKINYGRNFANLTHLSLINCNYNETILSNNITKLRLENCFITDITKIMRLKNLKELILSYNHIKKLPENINCKDLELLYLDNNEITRIDRNISQLNKLKDLVLNNNYKLGYISDELMKLKNMEILSAENCFELILSENLKKWIEEKFGIISNQSFNVNLNTWLFFNNYINMRKRFRNVENFIKLKQEYDIIDKLNVINISTIDFLHDLRNDRYNEDIISYILIQEDEKYISFIKNRKNLDLIFNNNNILKNIEKFFHCLMQMVLLPSALHRFVFLNNEYNKLQYLLKGEVYIKNYIKKMKSNINMIVDNEEYEPNVKLGIIINMIYSFYN